MDKSALTGRILLYFIPINGQVEFMNGGEQNNDIKVLDKQRVIDLMDGNLDDIVEIADLTVESISGHIGLLAEALSGNNIKAIELSSHSIKGTAANFGGDVLSEVAARIENAARSGDIGICESLMGKLDESFISYKKALADEGWITITE
ncbi:MAG: Hpt domain-containing protein [Planctomycetes bacterium]|nr:Hpt domain-containing protein [Planctomycetota bacterium]